MWKPGEISDVMRTVSGAMLSPPPNPNPIDSSSASTPSPPSLTASFRRPNLDLESSQFEVILNVDSAAALVRMGFITAVAQSISSRYQSKDPQCPDGLMNHIEAHIMESDPSEKLPPRDATQRMGIREDLQDVIMDPHFHDICMTQTLRYWIMDTMRTNYETIEHMLARSKKIARRVIEAEKFTSASIFSTTLDDFNLPAAHFGVCTIRPPLKAGHLRLYTGIAARYWPRWIEEDGRINPNWLFSDKNDKNGDFSSRGYPYYLTKEWATAEHYRFWAASRSPDADTWILSIDVPYTWLNNKPHKHIPYSRTWCRYVRACRHRKRPHPRDKIFSQQDWLFGPICSDGFLMRIGGSDCTQLAFMNYDVMEELLELVKGKGFHIDVKTPKRPTGYKRRGG